MTSEIKPEDVKLPEPAIPGYGVAGPFGGFTADQVRAAVLAERERCAALCDAQHFGGQRDDDLSWTTCAAHLAAAIRSGK